MKIENSTRSTYQNTKTIPVKVIAESETFSELNPEYFYTIGKLKSPSTSSFCSCGDGFWTVGTSEINFRLPHEAATRIVNEALSQHYIIAYLHLRTGQTGAVGRQGAIVNTETPPAITASDLTGKFKRPAGAIYRHERPELYNVKLKEIGGYEIWITPHNHFFIARGGVTAEPRQRADGLVFDPPAVGHGAPQEFIHKLTELLERQKQVRSRMVQEGEYDDDEDAWNWS